MRIAIDPGHGMGNRRYGRFDPGAVCKVGNLVYREADIVLGYGLKLRDQLAALDYEVFMTRTDNVQHTPLVQRTRRADKAGCQAFISLHTNSHRNKRVNGLEIYYKGTGAKGLAGVLQQELISTTGLRNRGIHAVPPKVDKARFSGVAILVELGFLSNVHDRTMLLDNLRETQVCQAICRVVKNTAAPAVRQA